MTDEQMNSLDHSGIFRFQRPITRRVLKIPKLSNKPCNTPGTDTALTMVWESKKERVPEIVSQRHTSRDNPRVAYQAWGRGRLSRLIHY